MGVETQFCDYSKTVKYREACDYGKDLLMNGNDAASTKLYRESEVKCTEKKNGKK